ncbi:serine/threonine protein kinase [Streptomyces sulfonofaciens]|uniref:Serine/threonine protein kinase n=1 Tax=Streptomyces sulfonofaciens TaxID=68272 RepID=A0A919GJD5_9ACTN|nr:class III lanthionine synthetase LanKC [Streptomyces sulfonofaciens]GHH85732.1 serine/threonine protein kinase [Streptomyces sulfonofaciens]
MNKGYAVYCDADAHFYDAPHRRSRRGPNRTAPYAAATAPVPPGWQRHTVGDWLALRPAGHRLPAQGWKIHVSACLDNAESVLDRLVAYCLARRIAFKFVPSPYLLHNRNAKYADRGASGKFATVYPADDEQCRAVAGDLDVLLAGEPGPYILSDLRWGRGPVHLRYGSFTQRHCYDADGELVPALEDAAGRLVPDVRGPVFRVPDWVEPPAFLKPHLDAREAVTLAGLPYTVERALHFSNGGGVYVARDERTGRTVVLKEARPHAGLAADGADAVTRLHRERRALERLSGLGCAPEVRDWFVRGDHHFLVLDHIAGEPLNTFFARRHPLVDADPSEQRLAEYTRWALRIHRLVEEAVRAVHGRGMVFTDLHLFNVMVSDDESKVTLLDFEAAGDVAESGRQTVANPGFVAPPDRRGFDIDRYALACLRLALFLPLTSLLAIDRGKAAHLADVVAEHFPVDRAFLDEAVAEILRDPAAAGTPGAHPAPRSYLPVRPGDWPRSRASMAAALHASATPHRSDRCFPGDIAQFARAGGGASFGYGTAGVLYALAESGAGRHPAGEEWLLRAAREPAEGTALGFYDGLAGMAWTLHRLGHTEDAVRLVDRILEEPWEALPPHLHGGLAGLGLALDSLGASCGEGGFDEAAQRCTDLVAGALRDTRSPLPRAGLLYGAAGPALLFVRRHERTGDDALLDLAADALGRDLDRCRAVGGGALQVDEGWRTMPYLGAGSVGIGMVLDDYLAHRDDERFARAGQGIVTAARSSFYVQPGLMRGAAGMVLYLSRTPYRGPALHEGDVDRLIDLLTWHAMTYRGHLAFPGEQMMRLSMDLSTGTAGCLLALAAARHESPAHLPFLPPLARPHEPAPAREPKQSTSVRREERKHHEPA